MPSCKRGSFGIILIAFSSGLVLFLPGHTSTHKEHPVQSSTETLIMKFSSSAKVFPLAFRIWKPSGAFSSSTSLTTLERITA